MDERRSHFPHARSRVASRTLRDFDSFRNRRQLIRLYGHGESPCVKAVYLDVYILYQIFGEITNSIRTRQLSWLSRLWKYTSVLPRLARNRS